MEPVPTIIHALNLTNIFDKRTATDVSFDVQKGEIFGFLGPIGIMLIPYIEDAFWWKSGFFSNGGTTECSSVSSITK